MDLTEDVSLGDMIAGTLSEPEVDCVGFEAHGPGCEVGVERPATVLNQTMEITRAGGGVGIPGLQVTEDPGTRDDAAKMGNRSIRVGRGWAKSLHFTTGQCPVMRCHRQLLVRSGMTRRRSRRRSAPR